MTPRNPFVFGEVIPSRLFVDRRTEIRNLLRDLQAGQKVFLLSPRRFGKSSLISQVFSRLEKDGFRTVKLEVSSYTSYAEFLEQFASAVAQAAGPWEKIKGRVRRFSRQVKPQISIDPSTSETTFTLSASAESITPKVAAEVFRLPEELSKGGSIRLAICLDEFQHIQEFNGKSVENALRNAAQQQHGVAYIFAGSQPTIMEQMLSPKRPFYKSGPKYILEKIPAPEWKAFITERFQALRRKITDPAIEALLATADLIPYDVQQLAHELWDLAELEDKRELTESDVRQVVEEILTRQGDIFERQWQQLTNHQSAVLRALAFQGSQDLLSKAVAERFRLGPASSVQKSLSALDQKDVIDRYKGRYFFLEPLFAEWIRRLGAH